MTGPMGDEDARALFVSPASDPSARDDLVERYRGFAEGIAGRFRGRAELEDLKQVAMLALVKAIDRFDPSRGVPFTAYAAATIVGELKRHLRDTAWAVRVPRQLQEAGLEIGRALDALTQQLGRSPTVTELAEATERSMEEVIEALEVGAALGTESLDERVTADGPSREPVDDDDTLELIEEWSEVADPIRELPERERQILHLRFFGNLSQSAIASELGISQMHVSRLLARTLERLREAARGSKSEAGGSA